MSALEGKCQVALKKLNQCEDDRKIPAILKAMPPELKMNGDVLKSALEKFDDEKIDWMPQLFKAMAPEVQMDEDVVRKVLEKCLEHDIPTLFAAMPPNLKIPEDIVKEALENCSYMHIHKLFAAMPADVKTQEDVAKKALEKCFDSYILELFAAMPGEVKMKENVVKALLKRCYNSQIPPIFEVMPFDVQTKEEDVKEALKGCNADSIPALCEIIPTQWKMNADVAKVALDMCYPKDTTQLFRTMPPNVKMQAGFATRALEKCYDYQVPEVFDAMPTEGKMQEDFVKEALEKCRDDEIPELFAAIPPNVKMQETVVRALLKKCYGFQIPRVFQVMPFDAQMREEDVKEALKGCNAKCIPALFEVIPTQWKMSEDVLKVTLEKCKIVLENCSLYALPNVFNAMPAQMKMQKPVVKVVVQRCNDKVSNSPIPIPIPAELQYQKEYVLIAVDVMDALDNKALQNFETRLPDYLHDDDDVKRAFERKKVSQLPFLQKYQKLLRAALKVSVMFLLVLGPIEGALWFQRSAGGKIANLSNQHWKNKTDFAQVHFEIFEGCVLSAAPQPFDITLPLTSLKLVIITAAFGFIKRDLMSVKENPQPRWQVWMCVGALVYSVIMIPISFFSLVVHYVQEVSPHIPGSFKKYECLYAIVNLAPFQTNYFMYLFQFLAGAFISQSAEIDIQCVLDDTWRRLIKCKFPRVGKEALVQPLLQDADTTIGQLQEFKLRGKFILFFLTLAPYLCVEIPFIITHKIPAAGCFFPFVLLIILVTGCIFAIVNRDLRHLKVDEWMKTVEEAGYLPIVPALWGLLVVNQFLTLAPIYWYGGAGWFDSGIMVLVERSLWIYVMVFSTKIMTKFWSAASFINEIS